MTQILVALGANLPRPDRTLAGILPLAVSRLAGRGIRVRRQSRIYRNPAHPPGSGPEFVNAVLLAETARPPLAVLASLQAVERSLGRRRLARAGPRTLDLDLVCFGGQVRPSPARWRWHARHDHRLRSARALLLLPHPAAHVRSFVLRPLLDVAPAWRHPALRCPARALWSALPAAERAGVRPEAGPGRRGMRPPGGRPGGGR